jgi:hypothetical protein
MLRGHAIFLLERSQPLPGQLQGQLKPGDFTFGNSFPPLQSLLALI